MIKLVFGLIATVFLTTFSFGQSPANSKNSYDYIGVIHNEVITEFFKNNNTPNMSIEDILKKAEPIILANDLYKSKFGNKYSSISAEEIKTYMPDISNNFSGLVKDANISDDAKSMLNNLLSSLSGATDFDKVYQDVISLEDDVIKSNLSDSEKELVLCSCSVARYSSYHWLVENPKPTFGNSLSARWRWWTIVADVAGGILGAPGGIAGIGAGAVGASLVSEAISNKD